MLLRTQTVLNVRIEHEGKSQESISICEENAMKRCSFFVAAAILIGITASMGGPCTCASGQAQVAWVQAQPATMPPPRWDHGMAFDTTRGRAVIYSGFDAQARRLTDTWEWDGTTWNQQNPAVSPPGRTNFAMAYDPGRGRVVLFGGLGANKTMLNDTWEWDGIRWQQITPPASPCARYDHAMAYDFVLGRVILFGGWIPAYDLNDTWAWDGKVWTQLNPVNSPPRRFDHALASDSARKRIVLSSGRDRNPTYFPDVWEWDGTNWNQVLLAAPSPSGRVDHALVYDALRGVSVLFGGYSGAQMLNDTWEWNGIRWTQRSPTQSPNPLSDYGMVYDTVRNQVVVFGGGVGNPNPASNNTWLYGATAWLAGSGPRNRGSLHNLHLWTLNDAGLLYVLGSSLGTGPIPLGTRNLGLTLDCLLIFSSGGFFPSIFQNYTGTLDAAGTANAAFAIPNAAPWMGLTIHSAFLTLNPAAPLGIQSISNTDSFTIL